LKNQNALPPDSLDRRRSKRAFWTGNFHKSQILSAFQKLTRLALYVTVKIPIPSGSQINPQKRNFFNRTALNLKHAVKFWDVSLIRPNPEERNSTVRSIDELDEN
jgi:hypothetical protein